MKRIIAFILLLATLVLSFSACGDEKETTTAKPASTEEATTEELTDSLPDKSFGGTEFTVLAAVQQWEEHVWSEDGTGDTLSRELFSMYDEVQERFDVVVVYDIVNGYSAGMSTVESQLKAQINTGECTYDWFRASAAYTGPRIADGLFFNLNDCNYLDLSAPWYSQDVNDNMTINGMLYVATGSASLQNAAEAYIVYYNKKVAGDLESNPDFYQMVKDGKWTFEQMLTYGKQATNEKDGLDGWTDGDVYGLLGTWYECLAPMAYGMGRQFTEIDSDSGLPVLQPFTEKTESIMTKIADMYNDEEFFYECGLSPYAEDECGVSLVDKFTNSEALFACYIIALMESDEMHAGDDFGVLPLPKYDEAQDKYYASLFPEIQAIPYVVKNLELSQYMMEAINAKSRTTVYPTYVKKVLRTKAVTDPDSVTMLDYAVDGLICDFGITFYTQINTEWYAIGLFIKRGQSASNFWELNEERMTLALSDLIDTLTNLHSED